MQPDIQIANREPMSDQPAMSRPRRPTVVANPARDRGFVERIDQCLQSGPSGPSDLEGALRPEYPAVVVRRREISHEPVEVWYVYRDGHWIDRNSDARG